MLDFYKRNRAIAVTAVSILLNLLLIRIIIEIGDSALVTSSTTHSMLPFITPYALAPILVAVLVGAAPAVLSALIIAVVFGIIQGNSIEFFPVAFLCGVVGSFTASNIRKRSQLVRGPHRWSDCSHRRSSHRAPQQILDRTGRPADHHRAHRRRPDWRARSRPATHL